MVKVKLPSKNLMESLLDLCKHRGFLFPSAEIHGGLRGAYDYGPLGVELKKNLVSEWWNSTVYAHDNVVGLDTSILTPSAVLRASGHVDGFTDDLVGCKLSNERFRPDKAPGLEVRYVTQANGGKQMTVAINAGSDTTAETWKAAIASTLAPGSRVDVQGPEVVLYPLSVTEATTDRDAPFVPGKIMLQGSTEGAAPVELPYHGYVSPKTGSFFLSESRPFNLMFKTFLDPIDPIERVIGETLRVAAEARTDAHAAKVRDQARTAVQGALHNSTVYLRPETAQGVFLNYLNCQRVSGLIPPFGIAQIGKSFRNEITLEHAIFRTPEFEQMELEYFVPPSQAPRHFNRWVHDRFKWWKQYARQPEKLRTRPHTRRELAHYASACVDLEYEFPWGWGEVEGIANRGDYDLNKHSKATDTALEYNDISRPASGIRTTDPEHEKFAQDDPSPLQEDPHHFMPHVIESSCGLNRALLTFLLDAYTVDPKNKRIVLRFHPRLAPIKVAILPIVTNNEEILKISRNLGARFRRAGISAHLDTVGTSLGKKYYKQDEIGTPWCFTIDFTSLEDGTVTIRDRDTTKQSRVEIEKAVGMVRDLLERSLDID